MLNRELSRQLQRLQDLIKKADDACDGKIELQAHWARYICVLSAGFLENAIKEVYADFARKQVSQPVANFVSSKLSPIRSPKAQLFLDIAAAFNATWRDELEIYLNDNGRGDAIDSIMANRHLIAHGKHYNSNISFVRVNEYLDKAIEVIEFIEQQCAR
jgi:hypothetical protein